MDDIKITRAKNSGVIGHVKKKLIVGLKMMDIGPISFYFGLKINQDRKKKLINLS